MDKKVAEAVLKRCKAIDGIGQCEYCTRYGNLELHHSVSGRGKRREHETEQSVYGICSKCHRKIHGKDGALMGRRLKIETQNRYKKLGYETEEIRQMMGGRLYFDDELEIAKETEKLRNDYPEMTQGEALELAKVVLKNE